MMIQSVSKTRGRQCEMDHAPHCKLDVDLSVHDD